MSTLLLVNSKNRITGNSSSYQVRLDAPLTARTIKLKEYTIPNTVYNIVIGGNNTNVDFCWYSNQSYATSIVPGKYTITSLLSSIQGIMNSLDPGKSYVLSYNDS